MVKVVGVVNPFFEQCFQILTNGWTLRDNAKAQLFSVSIGAGQSYPVRVLCTLNERPFAVHLARIAEDDSSPGTIPAHSFQWSYVNGYLEITFSGLDSGTAYTVDMYAQV